MHTDNTIYGLRHCFRMNLSVCHLEYSRTCSTIDMLSMLSDSSRTLLKEMWGIWSVGWLHSRCLKITFEILSFGKCCKELLFYGNQLPKSGNLESWNADCDFIEFGDSAVFDFIPYFLQIFLQKINIRNYWGRARARQFCLHSFFKIALRVPFRNNEVI